MIETLKIVLSGMFIIAGVPKLFRVKPIQDQFDEFGFANYFILIVGALEVIGAIGLQVSLIDIWVDLGLSILMIGAIYQHIKVKHRLEKSIPAVIMLVLLIFQNLLAVGII
ncbi:DoxX family protein [Ancylomarina sp. YFZ004]